MVQTSDLLLAPNRTLVVNTRNGYGASFTGAGGTIGGSGAGQNTFTNNGNGMLTLDANVWDNADDAAQVLRLSPMLI